MYVVPHRSSGVNEVSPPRSSTRSPAASAAVGSVNS